MVRRHQKYNYTLRPQNLCVQRTARITPPLTQAVITLKKTKMELLIFIIPFIFLVFIALTYDRTVTPTINWLKKCLKWPEIKTDSIKNGTNQTVKSFNLYDETFVILILALLYLTYEALEPTKSFEQRLITIPPVALFWILFLFKVHRIEVVEPKTIVFRGFIRNIITTAEDIVSIQDWLRGVRIVLKGRSIVLWPFIAKQGEFKSLIRSLNPDVEIEDMSNEATKTPTRSGFLLIVVLIYFAWLIWSLLYSFTHHIK